MKHKFTPAWTVAEHIDALQAELVAIGSWLAAPPLPLRQPTEFSSPEAWRIYTIARIAAKRAVEKREREVRGRLAALYEMVASGRSAAHDRRAARAALEG